MNGSTLNDQSLIITPHLSQGARHKDGPEGGKQLQNQLEQVLMMKSGEFSAGGPIQDRQYEQ